MNGGQELGTGWGQVGDTPSHRQCNKLRRNTRNFQHVLAQWLSTMTCKRSRSGLVEEHGGLQVRRRGLCRGGRTDPIRSVGSAMDGKGDREPVQQKASPGGFLECLVTWHDLKYSIITTRMCTLGANRKSEKVILQNVQGFCSPGELTAVIGASGAGKTSLLNLLAMRTRTGKVGGDILVNGEKVSKGTFRHLSGYVLQHDALLPFLTVEETLFYAAMLSLPKRLSFAEKMGKVKEVLTDLQLNGCRDTIVGSDLVRGVSGGERKRVSIGIELLRNPSVLFADEPTSGLDAKVCHFACPCLRLLFD